MYSDYIWSSDCGTLVRWPDYAAQRANRSTGTGITVTKSPRLQQPGHSRLQWLHQWGPDSWVLWLLQPGYKNQQSNLGIWRHMTNTTEWSESFSPIYEWYLYKIAYRSDLPCRFDVMCTAEGPPKMTYPTCIWSSHSLLLFNLAHKNSGLRVMIGNYTAG